jgi:hypothetical protein
MYPSRLGSRVLKKKEEEGSHQLLEARHGSVNPRDCLQ